MTTRPTTQLLPSRPSIAIEADYMLVGHTTENGYIGLHTSADIEPEGFADSVTMYIYIYKLCWYAECFLPSELRCAESSPIYIHSSIDPSISSDVIYEHSFGISALALLQAAAAAK